MLEKIKMFLAIVFLFAGFTGGMLYYFSLPYIYVSYSTKQCKFIEEADGTILPCSKKDPDQKYIQITVE